MPGIIIEGPTDPAAIAAVAEGMADPQERAAFLAYAAAVDEETAAYRAYLLAVERRQDARCVYSDIVAKGRPGGVVDG